MSQTQPQTETPLPRAPWGVLWWTADDAAEAEKWRADLTAKGIGPFKLAPQADGSGRIDFFFGIDKTKANALLGYEVDEEEWLVPEPFDNAQALAEGWDLFEADGTTQLQRIDWPGEEPGLGYSEPKFDSDDEALAFVQRRAEAGSKYHRDALAKNDMPMFIGPLLGRKH